MQSRFPLLFSVFLLIGSNLSAQISQQVHELLDAGKDLYYAGNYRDADPLFQEALELKLQEGAIADSQLMVVHLRCAKNKRYLKEHDACFKHLDLAQEVAQKVFGKNSEVYADVLMEKGWTYTKLFRPLKADVLYEEALTIHRNTYGAGSMEVGNTLMMIGLNHYQMGEYKRAEGFMKQAYTIFQKEAEPESEQFNRIYNNLGIVYQKMGDYDRALDYARRALEVKLKHYAPEHPSVAKYHRNIGRVLELQGKFEEALPYFEKSLSITEKALGSDHPSTGGAYGELGNIYADLHQTERALQLYRRAMVIVERGLPPTHPFVVAWLFNIAFVYEDEGAFEQALPFYQQALERFQQAEYAPPGKLVQVYQKIARMHFEMGNLETALQTIHLGIQTIVPNFQPQQFSENPALDDIQDPIQLLELLRLKARILKEFNPTDDGQEASFQTFELALDLTDRLRKGYYSEGTQQFLNEQTADLQAAAIQSAYERYQATGQPRYIEKAFLFSENSKAGQLRRALQNAQALETAILPESLREKLGDLKATIAELEELTEEEEDPQLYSDLVQARLDYEALIESLEASHPQYFQLKYQTAQLDLQVLQASLRSSGKAVVEYFYDAEAVYIFWIAESQLEWYRVPLEEPLAEMVSKLRAWNAATLKDPNSAQEGYAALLKGLSEKLVQPFQEELGLISELIIIPEGALQYLSFETLLTKAVTADQSMRNWPFLLQTHAIQYAWSAILWREARNKEWGSKKGMAAFAPDFGGASTALAARSGLVALPNAAEEVSYAAKHFKGELFLGASATEAQFYAEAPQRALLHLATHAIADDEAPLESGLWFSVSQDSLEDGFLSALEIYNLDLNAELVIMSACDSGYGKVATGEGVLSLGRAFAYAGCESVLMSLWLANDQSSSRIINGFYEELAAGAEKDQALRQAKLQFLKQADPLTSHPAYWGHLVLVGEASALSAQDTWPWWVWFVLIGGVFLVIYWFWRGRA